MFFTGCNLRCVFCQNVEISRGGGLASLRHQTGNYNVLYQTAIALMTYLPMNPLTKYKALSILFDYVLAAGTGVLAVMGTRRPDSASALPVSRCASPKIKEQTDTKPIPSISQS